MSVCLHGWAISGGWWCVLNVIWGTSWALCNSVASSSCLGAIYEITSSRKGRPPTMTGVQPCALCRRNLQGRKAIPTPRSTDRLEFHLPKCLPTFDNRTLWHASCGHLARTCVVVAPLWRGLFGTTHFRRGDLVGHSAEHGGGSLMGERLLRSTYLARGSSTYQGRRSRVSLTQDTRRGPANASPGARSCS